MKIFSPPHVKIDHALPLLSLERVMVLLAGYAWCSTAVLLARISPIASGGIQAAAGVVALLIFVAILQLGRRWHYVPPVLSFNKFSALSFLLFLGIVLRLAWVLAFPATPVSDGATYLHLAIKLLAGEPMQAGGAMAFWPPGYPFFLAPFLFLMPAALAVPFSQILLFALSMVGLRRVMRDLAGDQAASWTLLLFAVWPNLVMECATPEKEMLVATCLIWAVHGIQRATWRAMLFVGLMLGAAALVQPSTQLLIPSCLVLLAWRHRSGAIRLAIPLLLGTVIVIAPWTARNYMVFNTFKLISTNGGDVLYRANNPLATGAYTERGAIDFSTLPELEIDRAAKAAAVTWIVSNPLSFAELVVKKQLLFMGDDSAGLYATFPPQGKPRVSKFYAIAKLASNAWWLLAWAAIALLITRGARLGKAAFLVWLWLYLFGLHSIFESSSKYHVPLLWVLCCCLGSLLSRASAHKGGAMPHSAPARDAAQKYA